MSEWQVPLQILDRAFSAARRAARTAQALVAQAQALAQQAVQGQQAAQAAQAHCYHLRRQWTVDFLRQLEAMEQAFQRKQEEKDRAYQQATQTEAMIEDYASSLPAHDQLSLRRSACSLWRSLAWRCVV